MEEYFKNTGVKANRQIKIYAKDLFRLWYENAGYLLFVVQQSRYIYLNPACEKTTGYTQDELYQMRYCWEIVAPEYQHLIRERAQAREKGEAVPGNYEFKIINRAGEARWISYRGVLIDYAGRPAVLGSAIDITEWKRAAEASQEAELLYRTVFETSGTAIIIFEDDMSISLVNRAFEELSGYSREEIENKKKWTEFIAADDLPRIKKYHKKRQIDAASVPTKYEFQLLNRWGDIRDIYISVNIIPGTKRSVASFMDITERKKMQKSLRESEARWQFALEGAGDGLWDWNPVTNEVYFSKQWKKMLGYEENEITNSIAEWKDRIHPDDRIRVYTELKQHLAGLSPLYHSEYRLMTKDGSFKWILVRGKVISWEHNEKPLRFIGTHTDITERKKMGKLLFEEKERFKATLLSIGDGVIAADCQYKVVLLNEVARRLTGWTPNEAFGKDLADVFNIVDEHTQARCENPVYKLLRSGNISEFSNHMSLISKEGIERPIEYCAAPIKDEDGSINGVVLVFRDFTEKKQRQEKIEYLSFHDQLTGLYNRRYYKEEIKRLDTESNLPLTLVMADINGLKLTNDAFGHLEGDKLLIRVAQVLKKECRTDDIIARIGGDEFVMLLPRTSSEQAEMIVKRITDTFSNGQEISFISLGWHTRREMAEEMNAVFKRAEDNMYRRKLSESSSMRNRTLKVIMKTLYEKNKREEKHSTRVSQLCGAIGAALGLSFGDISELRTVGLMHDIGKITLDDWLLNKPGKLSDAECLEIKRHSEIGYRILSAVNEFSLIAEYVLAHHERWDGKGYPKGLKGAEIPFPARIIAIADSYDAMTTDRPYRKALTDDAALNEIKNNAGTQFDPDVSRVFVEKVLKKAWN